MAHLPETTPRELHPLLPESRTILKKEGMGRPFFSLKTSMEPSIHRHEQETRATLLGIPVTQIDQWPESDMRKLASPMDGQFTPGAADRCRPPAGSGDGRPVGARLY
jgi:hypothetical protein